MRKAGQEVNQEAGMENKERDATTVERLSERYEREEYT